MKVDRAAGVVESPGHAIKSQVDEDIAARVMTAMDIIESGDMTIATGRQGPRNLSLRRRLAVLNVR